MLSYYFMRSSCDRDAVCVRNGSAISQSVQAMDVHKIKLKIKLKKMNKIK